jgi:hypothetical protein
MNKGVAGVPQAGNQTGRKAVIALAIATVALAPAIAVGAAPKAKSPPIAVSFDRVAAFTPAGADPRLAAAFANRAPTITDFKFTPAAAKDRPSQIRVAVRAATTATASRPNALSPAANMTPLTPASYNLGVAVGWKRFAVSGDVEKQDNPNLALTDRESAVVGVSYNLKKFTGRVAVAAERNQGRVAALSQPDQYSVDLGGAYNISRRVAVTGGVRYRVDQDRAIADQRRDSQAVYVGTAFKF